MADAFSKTNASLEDLPKLKADLEEARQLLSRLEDRKGQTDADRYERLHERYEEQIDQLEPTVERLVEAGKTRKMELEDRLAHQKDKARDARKELEEIESLYEEGAMGEDAYREDQRRHKRQEKEAEAKVPKIERELDEVEFYLTKTGDVSYQKEWLRGKLGAVSGEVPRQVDEAVNQTRRLWEDFQMRLQRMGFKGQGWLLSSKFLWKGVGAAVLIGMLYWTLGGVFGGPQAAIFGGDSARTGVYEGPGPKAPVEAKWRFETGDEVQSSPAVLEGTVYVGSEDSYVYAIDAETGQEEWRFETGSNIFCSPAVVGETVYIGSTDNHLYAINAETGREKWRFEVGNGGVRSSPVVAGGTVYVGSTNNYVEDNYVYAIDAETGQEEWRFETGDGVRSSPAVAEGIVYVGSYDKNIYAIDAETGQQEWRFETEGEVYSAPAVVKGTVYTGSDDNRVYAIDAETGEEEWRFETGAGVGYTAVTGGTVYVGSSDNNVYAIDAGTGQEEWRFEIGDIVTSSPAVVGGTVYVGSQDGYLYALH